MLPSHSFPLYSPLCAAEMSWKVTLKSLLQGPGLPLRGRQSGEHRESCFTLSRPDAPVQPIG